MLKYRFLSAILPDSAPRRIALLTGARQTGKTTLARSAYPNLTYINLDAVENREIVRGLSTAAWSKSFGNSIVDEAQKEPGVFEKIKYAFDEREITFTLLLGSSQILLLKKIRETLAGRISIYEIWPLLMSELVRETKDRDSKQPLIADVLSGENLAHLLTPLPEAELEKTDEARRGAEAYLLQWGGMPGLLPLSDEDRWKWLKDYEYTYLERDLGDLARLDDLMPFRTFQKLSALRSGHLLNYSELARDAGISVDTARRYLEYLKLSYQTLFLRPFYRNLTSSVVKTPKLYWLDIGLQRRLTGMREGLSGNLYESMVVAEIYKWIKTVQQDAELYFYRTRSGLELDLLIQLEGGIVGCEIKSRDRVFPKDVQAMSRIAAVLGGEWLGGLVIYRGKTLRKIGEPALWAVPSRRLFT